MKIMSVVGARPNFMKAAPIAAAIQEYNRRAGWNCMEHVLVHTGQHYDPIMSDSFFQELGLPQPSAHLGVGSGSHAAQTADIMRKFEGVLLAEKPDVLIVVGDVNSTVGCALVAAKISFDANGTRPLIAHVEAGLRSFDRAMPEEVNRIVTDSLADLLFVTEESGLRNLESEGVPAERVHFAGNTMIDSLLAFQGKADESTMIEELGLRDANGSVRKYALLTLHRPANVDSRAAFVDILEGLQELLEECPVIFAAHPRTQKSIREMGLEQYFETASEPVGSSRFRIRIIPPLGYLDFLCLMKNAHLVVTDSGGIQEETTCLGVRCITLRENTERPVTITAGTNVLAGVKKEGIQKAIRQQLGSEPGGSVPEKWDGKSALRILDVLIGEFEKRAPASAIHHKYRAETTA